MIGNKLKKIREKYSKKIGKKHIDKLTTENKKLKQNVRDLFWNICRQPEKVPSCLITITDEIYKDIGYDEKAISKIRSELRRKLRNGLSISV